MTEQNENGGTPPEPATPPAAGNLTDNGLKLTNEQQAVLKEHGITVPEDGKISVAEHVKLLSTLASQKQSLKQAEAAKEAARLAGLDEAERKLEEAKAAGRAEAEAAYKVDLIKARIAAEAATAGFNDPADAHSMIPDLSALDAEEAVKAAVAKLADDKPYLLKTKKAPSVEGGPQGGPKDGAPVSGNAWLRGELTR